MTAAEWDDLARLAQAATPGPWFLHEMGKLFVGNGAPGSLWQIVHMSGDDLADLTDEAADRARADAEFIAAANPATILRLIADLRESRAQTERILARRRTEAEAERDAVAQDLARMAARLAAVEAAIRDHARELFSPAMRIEAVPVDRLRAVLSAAPTTTPDLETPDA